MSGETTYVFDLTPSGRAAVAVVLVAGPAATDVIEQCFVSESGRRLSAVPVGRICLGRWASADGEQLIVCRRSADRVEVHCHGGMAALRAVMDRLTTLGCIPTSWQAWTRRTEADPIRAAALIALAEAPTARTAAILLDQSNGALATSIRQAIAAADAKQWPQLAGAVDDLLSRGEFGLHLTQPWRVVLAGQPNVGKSSLLNALAGFQRAIVSALPGTTRDVVTVTTAIDGWPVVIADTAGLRDARDELESAGITLASGAISGADLLIVVHDAETDCDLASLPAIAGVNQSPAKVIHVVNKVDLVAAERRRTIGSLPCHFTSVVTSEGIPELIDAIGQMLVPIPPAAGAAVPLAADHLAALRQAREAIQRHDAKTAGDALRAMIVSRHSVP